jgi:hypothetical protein
MNVVAYAFILIGHGLLVRAGFGAEPVDNTQGQSPALFANPIPACASGNDMVVKLSSSGGILTCQKDGVWIEQPLSIRTFLRDVTFANGRFVAVGGSYVDVPGAILTSRDGLTWVRQHPQNKINLHRVTYGRNLFVTVGDAGTIFISREGMCWRKCSSGTSAMLSAVAFGKDTFVAGGESGTILISTNGVQWTAQSLGNSFYVGKLLFRDGTFLAECPETTFASADGRTWIRHSAQTVRIP